MTHPAKAEISLPSPAVQEDVLTLAVESVDLHPASEPDVLSQARESDDLP